MCNSAADQISLFRAQIANRRFDDGTLRILESVLVSKDVKSSLEIRSMLKEFLRHKSICIIRELAHKPIEQKLCITDFLVRAFALAGDAESCLALRYEALLMRETRSSGNQWLRVSYGEWFTFAEHCLDNGFFSIAIKASEKALSCFQMEPPTKHHIENIQLIEKMKTLNEVAVVSAASKSVQAQASEYLKKKKIEYSTNCPPTCKDRRSSASVLFRNGIKKRNKRKLQEYCSLLKSPATRC